MSLKLVIGNKNYSSWSVRPWVLMKQAGIPFEEVMLRFDDMGPDSHFKREIARYSPAGRVPVLVDDGFMVWDTLAIAEYLAEKFPQLSLWPEAVRDRARARSVCAEMHAGFEAMRSVLAMNIELHMPEVGPRMLAERADLRADLQRIFSMWTELLSSHGGPFLFGVQYTIPDAYYAPVCSRLRSYGVPMPAPIARYVDTIMATQSMKAWVADALQEKTFVAIDEPYRTRRD